MTSEGPDVHISELVKSTIERRIIEAFRDTPQMIDELVRACLELEVNEYGGKPDLYTRQKMPYLTWLARDAVRSVAESAIREYIDEMRESIKEQVQQSLCNVDVVDAFTNSIISATSTDWKIEVTFKPP